MKWNLVELFNNLDTFNKYKTSVLNLLSCLASSSDANEFTETVLKSVDLIESFEAECLDTYSDQEDFGGNLLLETFKKKVELCSNKLSNNKCSYFINLSKQHNFSSLEDDDAIFDMRYISVTVLLLFYSYLFDICVVNVEFDYDEICSLVACCKACLMYLPMFNTL